jgi:hypothetical protein
MVEYIPLGLFRSSFKFCMGDKLREKMEGGKRDEKFSVHFNLHKPIQIVFFKNFGENSRTRLTKGTIL